MQLKRKISWLIVCLISAICVVVSVSDHAFANYNNAQTFFKSRAYARAAPEFFKSYAYPNNRSEKLKSEWGLAQSLQQMGLLYSASKYYSVIVRRGPGKGNAFYQNALEQLGRINSTVSLGRNHIGQLFKGNISTARIPGKARGFYFYYKGLSFFSGKDLGKAQKFFSRVTSASDYFLKAKFHLAVIANIQGSHQKAISLFEQVRRSAPANQNGQWLREQASLNIARVHYETKRFVDSIRYYSEIPRSSDNWLQTIFESAWAFFLMEKHNNTLGNIHTIHSPFFINRFYPESYILQAITFLRLCRLKQVNTSLKQFKRRYSPVLQTLNSTIRRFRGQGSDFYRLIYRYRERSLGGKYRGIYAILDALSRTDTYKEANATIRSSNQEISRLSNAPDQWRSVGLVRELSDFLKSKKGLAASGAGRLLLKQTTNYRKYLKRLSDQTAFINLQKKFVQVDSLRNKLGVGSSSSKTQFIGGLQALNLSQDLEYWPFVSEYWEDELGYYVYNLNSRCSKKK